MLRPFVTTCLAMSSMLLLTSTANAKVPPSTVRVNCPSKVKIQDKINAAVAGNELTIALSGACTENIFIPSGKVIAIEPAVAGASLSPLDNAVPTVASEGHTTIRRMIISNSTGTADALVMANDGGFLEIYGSTLTAPNVMAVAAAWTHSGSLIKNSRITGGTDHAVEAWEGGTLALIASPDGPSGPDGYKTVISSPEATAVGCGIGSSLIIRAFKSNSANGSILINNSKNGVGGSECSAHIKNHTDQIENLQITGIAADGAAISFDKSTINLQNLRIVDNDGTGLHIRMSTADIVGAEFSNNTGGDISANYDSTIMFFDLGGRATSLPDVEDNSATISCGEGANIYVPDGAVQPDLKTIEGLQPCITLE